MYHTNKTIQKLPVGESDFKILRENNYYYIDKTMLIEEIINNSAKVILLPRPRRFGKTLNLSMLRYFFEKRKKNLKELFNGTMIQSDEVFAEHQGQYPVIYLSFKDCKENSWDLMTKKLNNLLSDEFERHSFLLDSDRLSEKNKHYIETIINRKANIVDCADSLRYLSSFLNRSYQKQVVILIDEYDTPLHSGYQNGYYNDMVSFMRNFLSGGLKDNVHLHKGVMTGILRVAKESIFSGLNNLGVFTLLNMEFNTGFGFSEDEVRNLLRDYDLIHRYDEVSYWYNGYLFGGETIYNPWSVLNFINSKDQLMRPYWVNTASNEIIEQLATREGREIREELGTLLEGGSILKPVYDSIIMSDITTKSNLLWSFMLFSGYLKYTGPPVRQKNYPLTIPNHEVRIIYEDLVINWFDEKTDAVRLEEMLTALENGRVKLFERILKKIVLHIMSYHDFGDEPERVYHALVLGMLVWLGDQYEIRSNRESGLGRYDLMLKPNNRNKIGIIIEFKLVDEGETYQETLDNAMQQIKDKRYIAELEAAGIQTILKIAVAFKGKELWMLHE